MNQFPRVLPSPYLPLAPGLLLSPAYVPTCIYNAYMHKVKVHVHMQSICIHPSCIYAYGTHPLFRIKSDSLRKKYKFGIHTRGSDPFVRSYIEKKSKRKRKERTAVLGTVVETSQVVAIGTWHLIIHQYLHVPIVYLSLPRYLVKSGTLWSSNNTVVIKSPSKKPPKIQREKSRKKKGEKKSHRNPSSPRRRPKGPRFGQG